MHLLFLADVRSQIRLLSSYVVRVSSLCEVEYSKIHDE